jgi:hypothetical protein
VLRDRWCETPSKEDEDVEEEELVDWASEEEEDMLHFDEAKGREEMERTDEAGVFKAVLVEADLLI